MRLTPPKKITFWISVILGALGVLATFVAIPVLSGFAFWLVVIGFVLLVLALLIKGL